MNSKARYQIETPLDEVMGAEMISYPNTKLMCSVNVDGAAAAVICSEKKARELGLSRAVKVKASVLTSDRWTQRDLTMPDVNTCTREAAEQAYEMAGVGADDIDLVAQYDTAYRSGQIGGLSDLNVVEQAEGELGEAPIIEFRDLGDKKPSEMKAVFEKIITSLNGEAE